MPRQNRVTPEGEIVALPQRGTLMGNRGGRIHRDDGTLGPSRWVSKQWIACRLCFKGRRREVMGPGYTELFFLDEATACAAGHRPCAECRREDFTAFARAWEAAHGRRPLAAEMDAALHAARVTRTRLKVIFDAPATDLPDGAMIRLPAGPALVWEDAALPWTPSGYGPAAPRPAERVPVLTPAPMVATFRAGYRPARHPGLA